MFCYSSFNSVVVVEIFRGIIIALFSYDYASLMILSFLPPDSSITVGRRQDARRISDLIQDRRKRPIHTYNEVTRKHRAAQPTATLRSVSCISVYPRQNENGKGKKVNSLIDSMMQAQLRSHRRQDVKGEIGVVARISRSRHIIVYHSTAYYRIAVITAGGGRKREEYLRFSGIIASVAKVGDGDGLGEQGRRQRRC
jgi:hypothetical protein